MKQDQVEAAIREAEQRAAQRERLQAAGIAARIEDLAQQAASQPKAVQAAVRSAVREAEAQHEAKLAAVHEAYMKASAEQQAQVKALLEKAQQEGAHQSQVAINAAVTEMRLECDARIATMTEQARETVQFAAKQQADELDGLLAEMAELRAENSRVSAEVARLERRPTA